MKRGMILIFFAIFLLGIISITSASFCCEKTTSGAWCINVEEKSQCNPGSRIVSTSCEATSYCKLGCCYNSQEGTCTENTPQKVCEEPADGVSVGIWESSPTCDIAQCNLGCCLLGDQATFVTQTRCKRLAFFYGIDINFRTDIDSEFECIMSATSDEKGACVYEKDFEKTCRFITQKECKDLEAVESNVSFHRGYLCSSDKLGTTCSSTQKTTCVEGRDEVFFVDSCGNLANIYNSAKIEDKEYWSKVYSKNDSCKLSSGNKATCGNCDYFSGTTCKTYKIGDRVRPTFGDNICVDLGCEYDTDFNGEISNDEKYAHGETWCAENNGVSQVRIDSKSEEITSTGEDLPGGRYFRLVCYNGEVTVEPCADFRQEICLQSSIGDFKTAACKVNRWQECLAQDNQQDCENTDKRDCKWIFGPLTSNYNPDDYREGMTIFSKAIATVKGAFEEIGGKKEGYSCVPKFTPGYDFWNSETDATELCSVADTHCTVTYKTGLFHDVDTSLEDCSDNCDCIMPEFEKSRNRLCSTLGDCGAKMNYYDLWGYDKEDVIEKKEVKN